MHVAPESVAGPLQLIEACEHESGEGGAPQPENVAAAIALGCGPGEPEAGDQGFPEHAGVARREVHAAEHQNHDEPGDEADPPDLNRVASLAARTMPDDSLRDDKTAYEQSEDSEVGDGEGEQAEDAGDLAPEGLSLGGLEGVDLVHGQFAGTGVVVRLEINQFLLCLMVAELCPDFEGDHLKMAAGGEVHIGGRRGGGDGEEPEEAEDAEGERDADREAALRLAAREDSGNDCESKGDDKAVQRDVGDETEEDGNADEVFPGELLLGAAPQNGGDGKGHDGVEHVAARDYGILIRQPEAERQQRAQDERKRRVAQENVNAGGGDDAGCPVHSGNAEVEAREDPEEAVPQAGGALVADLMKHEVPPAVVAGHEIGLGF